MGIERKPTVSLRNIWLCLAISIGNVAYAYSAAIIGPVLSQDSFFGYMKLVGPKGLKSDSQALIGAMSGVLQAGALIGIFSTAWVMDRWGRKAGVLYCAITGIIGTAGSAGAVNVGMFITFRFITGLSSGFLSVCPVFATELAPAHFRGFLVGLNGTMIAFGYALSTYMGLAFHFSTNPTTQWRGPLGIGIIFPSLILLILPFLPESPRYLLMKQQPEKAWEIILSLHSSSNDPDQIFARTEFYQVQKQIELDRTLSNSWFHMLRKPSYRKRALIAMGYAFFGESTAVLVINNYSSTLYKTLGFGATDQLAFQSGYNTVAVLFNIVGSLILDRVGRRFLMLWGLGACCICLIVNMSMVAAFTGVNHNDAGVAVAISALFCFIASYAIGVDVAGIVFFGELFPNHIRAKGFSLAVATKAAADLVYLQSASTAFAAIGWKFYLLFICLSFIGFCVMFFVLPETKNIPLEELSALFGDADEVVLYLRDLTVDSNTHGLVLHTEGKGSDLTREVTEMYSYHVEKPETDHVSTTGNEAAMTSV